MKAIVEKVLESKKNPEYSILIFADDIIEDKDGNIELTSYEVKPVLKAIGDKMAKAISKGLEVKASTREVL